MKLCVRQISTLLLSISRKIITIHKFIALFTYLLLSLEQRINPQNATTGDGIYHFLTFSQTNVNDFFLIIYLFGHVDVVDILEGVADCLRYLLCRTSVKLLRLHVWLTSQTVQMRRFKKRYKKCHATKEWHRGF